MTLPKRFLAWNGEQMIVPDYIDRNSLAWWKENSIPVCSKDVVQWTGIDDLYEGDIVKVEIGSHDGVKEITCIVVFHQCAFMFKAMWEKDRYLWIPERKYKKVGNKFGSH